MTGIILTKPLKGPLELALDDLVDVNDPNHSGSPFGTTTTTGQRYIFEGNTGGNGYEVVEAPDLDPTQSTGFHNRIDSVFSFDDGTRTFTISPAASPGEYFIRANNKNIYISTPMSVQIPDISGFHYIYIDEDAVIHSTNIFDLYTIIVNNAYVAMVYWESGLGTAIFIGDERHGYVMDWATHMYLHTTVGTAYQQGLALTGIVPNGTGTLNSSAQFGTEAGIIQDEDIIHNISGRTNPATINIFYRFGSSSWHKKVGDSYPLIYSGDSSGFVGASGLIAYNQNVAGNWQLTEAGNNNFVLVHYFASSSYTEDQRIFGILGQTEYATISEARAGANTEISVISLSELQYVEVIAIGTVIFQTKKAFSNVPKAVIVSTDDGESYVDWRTKTIPGGGSGITDHGLLSGLTDDDHPQYLNITRGDARYYTETEINEFFAGTTPITGYNKTNWDTAYGWGNWATGVNKAFVDALGVNADTVDNAHVGTSGAAIPLLNGTNTWSGTQAFNSSSLKLNGSTSGTGTLNAPAAASTYTWTLPAFSGTIAMLGGSAQVFTNAVTFTGTSVTLGNSNADLVNVGGGTARSSMSNGSTWQTTTTAGQSFSLSAYNTTGATYSNLITLTAGTTGTLTIDWSKTNNILRDADAFVDSDAYLMTAAAIQNKIESYGYTTEVGDITAVTAGAGLAGGGTSGDVSLSHADTSTIADFVGAGGIVVSGLSFDTYGHVQTASTIDLDGRYYTETETDTLLLDKIDSADVATLSWTASISTLNQNFLIWDGVNKFIGWNNTGGGAVPEYTITNRTVSAKFVTDGITNQFISYPIEDKIDYPLPPGYIFKGIIPVYVESAVGSPITGAPGILFRVYNDVTFTNRTNYFVEADPNIQGQWQYLELEAVTTDWCYGITIYLMACYGSNPSGPFEGTTYYDSPTWELLPPGTSLVGHTHVEADITDLDKYTQTEINDFFSGTTPITGYNNTNWDTAYGWGDWSVGVNKTFVDALGINADTVDGAHVGTSGATIPLLNGTNTWSGTQTFGANTIQISGSSTGTGSLIGPVDAATYSWTLPELTGTIALLDGGSQTFSNALVLYGPQLTIGNSVNDLIVVGKGARSSMDDGSTWQTTTTAGHTFSLSAYDTTGVTYVDLITLTAGTSATLTIDWASTDNILRDADAFVDSDAYLMTAAAIQNKIESYGYTTEVGDITAVTAGTGLAGGGTSGDVSLSHADTSAVFDVMGLDGTVLNGLTFDEFGHVTNYSVIDLDSRYYTETETDTLLLDKLDIISLSDYSWNGGISFLNENYLSWDGATFTGWILTETGGSITPEYTITNRSVSAKMVCDGVSGTFMTVRSQNKSDYPLPPGYVIKGVVPIYIESAGGSPVVGAPGITIRVYTSSDLGGPPYDQFHFVGDASIIGEWQYVEFEVVLTTWWYGTLVLAGTSSNFGGIFEGTFYVDSFMQDILPPGTSLVGHTHVEADITDLDKYTQTEVNTLLDAKLDVTRVQTLSWNSGISMLNVNYWNWNGSSFDGWSTVENGGTVTPEYTITNRSTSVHITANGTNECYINHRVDTKADYPLPPGYIIKGVIPMYIASFNSSPISGTPGLMIRLYHSSDLNNMPFTNYTFLADTTIIGSWQYVEFEIATTDWTFGILELIGSSAFFSSYFGGEVYLDSLTYDILPPGTTSEAAVETLLLDKLDIASLSDYSWNSGISNLNKNYLVWDGASFVGWTTTELGGTITPEYTITNRSVSAKVVSDGLDSTYLTIRSEVKTDYPLPPGYIFKGIVPIYIESATYSPIVGAPGVLVRLYNSTDTNGLPYDQVKVEADTTIIGEWQYVEVEFVTTLWTYGSLILIGSSGLFSANFAGTFYVDSIIYEILPPNVSSVGHLHTSDDITYNGPAIQPSLYADFVNGKRMPLEFTVDRNSVAWRFDHRGKIVQVSANTAVIDYYPGTRICRGLRIGSEFTNLGATSETMTAAQGWNNINVDFGTGIPTPIEGVTSNYIIPNTTSANHNVSDTYNFEAGKIYTCSIMAKVDNDEYTICRLIPRSPAFATNVNYRFDFKNGTSSAIGAGNLDYGFIDLGDGWYWVWVTGLCISTTTTNCAFQLYNSAVALSYAGDGIQGIHATGWMFHEGYFPYRYAPTYNNTPTTVLADNITISGSSFTDTFNLDRGSVVMDIEKPYVDVTTGILSLNNNNADEVIDIKATNTILSLAVTDLGLGGSPPGGSPLVGIEQANFTIGTLTAFTETSIAVSFTIDDFAAVQDGGTVATDTSGTIPTTTLLQLGADQAGNISDIWIKNISIYNEALTDTEITQLTSLG